MDAPTRLTALLREEAARPFDLASDSMMRVCLVTLGVDDHVLALTLHHIASDGWSIGVLVKEFAALYSAAAQGIQANLKPLPIQYADYAAWQRSHADHPVQHEQLAYWSRQLADLPVAHGLPLDRPRPLQQSFIGGRVRSSVDARCITALDALARRHDATVFMALEAAFALLIGRYSGESDVVVGSPIAGRTHEDTEPLIGFFINTLVMRNDLSGDVDFHTLLDRTREMALSAFTNQDLPFDTLVDELNPSRSLSHAPLFQLSFTLHNLSLDEISLPGLVVSDARASDDVSRYDIELHATEAAHGMSFSWLFAASLFDSETIERLAAGFSVLLEAIADDASMSIQALPVLDATHRAALVSWGEPSVRNRHGHLSQASFETHVRSRPDAIAVVGEDGSLTYAELDRKANRVANYLRSQGVSRESLVGLCVDRSPDMMVGILGILKAGAAYLPMDPTYPEGRLGAMLADAKAEVVVTQMALLEAVPVLSDYTLLPLDEALGEALLRDQPDSPPDLAGESLDGTSLAYAVFTSGSTGVPKGALIEHASLVNLAASQGELYDIRPESRVLAFASIGFDAAAWEWMMALCHGATLYIATESERHSVRALETLLLSARITHATLPPALLVQMAPSLSYAFERLILAGEACEERLAWTWAERFTVCNAYGPSEATVCVTSTEVHKGDRITLGHALPNVETLVADAAGAHQPIGAPGELLVGGAGLARGYLHRPELTAERFLTHPSYPDRRLYRTGDLVRRLATGELEFLGRVDAQVKMRGFRIEPGEIEARLGDLPGVDRAVVIMRGEGAAKRLVAYVIPGAVGDDQLAALPAILRVSLKRTLPDYMLPSAIVLLERIPLTRNGKVDTRALPEPTLAATADRVIPTTDLERALVALWSDLLQVDVEAVGATSNFFDLGGHSLLAIRLVAALEERFGSNVGVRDIFNHATPRELASLMQSVDRPMPATPLQTLGSGAGGPVVYLVPAAGLGATSYLALAREVDNRAVLKLLEPRGTQGDDEPHRDLDALVAEGLTAIAADCPSGPIHLVGHSFGAVVAFEIACTFERQGRDVRLMLLDSLLELSDVPGALAHTVDRPAVTRDAGEAVDAMWRVYEAQRAIQRNYAPRAMFGGEVMHLRARDGHIVALPAETLRAQDSRHFVREPVHAIVDGGHLSMLRSEYVSRLADAISEAS
jgi:amino acid adenylation domain-containing protein